MFFLFSCLAIHESSELVFNLIDRARSLMHCMFLFYKESVSVRKHSLYDAKSANVFCG